MAPTVDGDRSRHRAPRRDNLTDRQVTGGRTVEPATEMHRSSRDPARLRTGLETWLRGVLPAGADPVVPVLEGTSANGMSSETLLFDAEWQEAGTARAGRLVARVA